MPDLVGADADQQPRQRGFTAPGWLFIDDSAANVQAARALGIAGVVYHEFADMHRVCAGIVVPNSQ